MIMLAFTLYSAPLSTELCSILLSVYGGMSACTARTCRCDSFAIGWLLSCVCRWLWWVAGGLVWGWSFFYQVGWILAFQGPITGPLYMLARALHPAADLSAQRRSYFFFDFLTCRPKIRKGGKEEKKKQERRKDEKGQTMSWSRVWHSSAQLVFFSCQVVSNNFNTETYNWLVTNWRLWTNQSRA